MKNKKVTEDKAQTSKPTKGKAPVKNSMTDSVKNSAQQSIGLNQAKTKRDDLFPSDGDNMTK